MSFTDFLKKYSIDPKSVAPEFISGMDSAVAPIMTPAWPAGLDVTGKLSAALNPPTDTVQGCKVLLTAVEADVALSLAPILAGTPIVPGVVPPVTPKALKAVLALGGPPSVTNPMANAILDWIVSLAANPASIAVASLKAAPYPPIFIPL